MPEVLISLNIIIPLLLAALIAIIRNSNIRKTIVVISGIMLAVTSISIPFFTRVPGLYSLGYNFALELVIKMGDFVLLFYALWVAHQTGEKKIAIFTWIQLLALTYFEVFMLREQTIPTFFVDRLSILMNGIVSIVGSIIAIFALGYMDRHEKIHNVLPSKQKRFFAIMLMFLGAMNGLVFSNNLMAVYFFWEVTSLCSFLMISHDGTKEAIANGARALWMNMMGGAGFILGIMYLYRYFNIVSLQELLNAHGSSLLAVAIILLSFAAFTKSAQMPFESWLLGAMVAPTPVSALLHSSTMVKAGIYLLLRLTPIMKGSYLSYIISLYGAYTFVAASILALSQSNAKKILAYSTVSNLGLMIASIGIDTPSAVTAAILLLLFHAVSKALLFLCVGTIEQDIGSRDIEDMKGLISRMPITTLVTVIGIMTLMIAPFGMLLSKWLAIEAASRHFPVAVMMAAGSAVSVLFYSRWAGNLVSTTSMRYSSLKDMLKRREKLPGPMIVSLESLALMAPVLSLFIGKIFNVFIKPEINLMKMPVSIRAATGSLTNGGIGGFAVYPAFIMIFLAVVFAFLSLKNAPMLHTTPYVCGLNYNESKYDVKNYYLGTLWDENKIKRFMDIISIILILILIGGMIP